MQTNMKPNDSQAIERAIRVFELRLQHATYSEIARQLNCSPSTAHADVQREIKYRREQLAESVDDVRIMELADLDQHERKLSERLQNETDFDKYLRGLAMILKIKQRRADMEGLDKARPAETNIMVGITVNATSPDDKRVAFVNDMQQRLGRVPTVKDVLDHVRRAQLDVLENGKDNGNGKHVGSNGKHGP